MWIFELNTDRNFRATTSFDISLLCNMSETNIKDAICTSSLKSAATSCSIRLRYNEYTTLYDDAIQFILIAKQNRQKLYLKITDPTTTPNATIVFQGVVSAESIDLESAKIAQGLSLEAKDFTVELDRKIGHNEVFESQPYNTLATTLLKYAGQGFFPTSDIVITQGKTYYTKDSDGIYKQVAVPVISELPTYYEWSDPISFTLLTASDVKDYFVLDEKADGDKTYRQKIDTLLFEVPGYVLHFVHATGKYEIVKSVYEIPQTSETPRTIDFAVKDKLKTKNAVYDKDGVLVKWYTVKEKENQNVYTASLGWKYDEELGKTVGTTIPKKVGDNISYYPDTGNLENITQDFAMPDRDYELGLAKVKNKDISLLYVKPNTATLVLRSQGGTLVHNAYTNTELGININPNPTFYPTYMQLLLWNTSTTEDVDLQQITVEGTAVYKARENQYTVPNKVKDAEEYTSEIYNATQAESFTKWFYNAKLHSQTNATWTEYSDSRSHSYLGEVVRVQHKGVGLAQDYIVIQIENAPQIGTLREQKVTAYAISGWVSSPIVHKQSTLASYTSTQRGAISVVTEYGISDTSTDEPLTWGTSYTYTENKWLWTRITSVYADGNSNTYISNKVFMPKLSVSYETVAQYCLSTSAAELPQEPVWTESLDSWRHGYFVWSRYKYIWDDGSEDTYSTARYDQNKTNELESTCVFEFVASRMTYVRNLRLSGGTDISLSPKVIGYGSLNIGFLPSTYVQGGNVNIPNNNNIDSLVIQMVAEYTKPDETTENLTYELTLTVVDETEKNLNLGLLSSAPSEAGSYGSLLAGDFFTNSTTKKPQYYDGTTWNNITNQSPNYQYMLLNTMEDVFSLSDIPQETKSLYGYFKEVIAQNIGVQDITLLNGNNDAALGKIHSDGYTENDFRETDKDGFYLDSKGTAYFSDVHMKKADVTGKFTAEAMETQEAVVASEVTGSADTTAYGNYSDFYNKLNGLISNNTVTDSYSGSYNGSSYTKIYKKTSAVTETITLALGGTWTNSGFKKNVKVVSGEIDKDDNTIVDIGGTVVANKWQKSTLYNALSTANTILSATGNYSASSTISQIIKVTNTSTTVVEESQEYSVASRSEGEEIIPNYQTSYPQKLTLTRVYDHKHTDHWVNELASISIDGVVVASGYIKLPYTITVPAGAVVKIVNRNFNASLTDYWKWEKVTLKDIGFASNGVYIKLNTGSASAWYNLGTSGLDDISLSLTTPIQFSSYVSFTADNSPYSTGLNLCDSSGVVSNVLTSTKEDTILFNSFTCNQGTTVILPDNTFTRYYKFLGLLQNSVAASPFDARTYAGTTATVKWTKRGATTNPNITTLAGLTPYNIVWDGATMSLRSNNVTAYSIKVNDYVSSQSIQFTPNAHGIRLVTQEIAPMGDGDNTGLYDIGSSSNKYDDVWANNFHGNLSGNVTGNVTGNADTATNATNATNATKADKVKGIYTSRGGKQNPDYYGKNTVGFLMSNQTVNGNSQYKDWIYMDCYSGADVGGAVALGVCRQSMKAFIMGSEATRTSWDRSAELLTNLTTQINANINVSGTSNKVYGAVFN